MEELGVNFLSKVLIKPSSQTPDHLRFYQLSFLDQITVPVFMPLVLFYPNNPTFSNLERCDLVKKSLSQALTVYYPLAGRVKDSTYIDCNDEGVYFVEAQANCQLSDVLENPIPSNNNKLIPFEIDDVRDLVAVLQVTFFMCGGMAIGIGMCHKIGDALSLFMFLNTWSIIARQGDTTTIPFLPRFESSTLFPPKNVTGFQPRTGIVKDNIASKRFVFDASTILALRDKYSDKASMEKECRPTRVEALSAFIWSRFMASTRPEKGNGEGSANKIYTILHAVNLRPRMDPPLQENYFGNISRFAIAIPNMDTALNDEDGCHEIIKLMKDAIKNVDVDYVKNELQQSDNHLNFIKERAEKVVQGELVSFNFTSLCRFPTYDADFGWGKPAWVGSTKLTFKNLVTFLDTKEGGGIEAWINVMEDDMAKLEADEEFLAHLSPNVAVTCTAAV